MSGIKSLAGDTAVYGISTVLGRLLNWLLVPLYTYVFSTGEYGVVAFVYSITAFALVLLTYGMETGYFYFANPRKEHNWKDPSEVYSTCLVSILCTSTVFVIAVVAFLPKLSALLKCSGHDSYVMIMALCVAIDAFLNIPFAYLRQNNKRMKYAALKFINVCVNIGFNLFFILLCPWLMEVAPATVGWFYDPSYGIGYIFLSNLLATIVNLIMLLPELRGFRWRFNNRLWRSMIIYSAPLLIMGLAGILNQNVAQILYPYLPSAGNVMSELGIYSANYRIALILVVFLQAFRMAYDPFIFSRNKEVGKDYDMGKDTIFSDVMNYFIISTLVIFLAVMFYLNIIRYLIAPRFWGGLGVVPIVMMGEIFFAVFYNLSAWYKLGNQTRWGMYFSLIGVVVTFSVNILLVPSIGYMACAWGTFACYGTMMAVSYLVGLKKSPIRYRTAHILSYFLLAAIFYFAGMHVIPAISSNIWFTLVTRTLLLVLFCIIAAMREKKLVAFVKTSLLHRRAKA